MYLTNLEYRLPLWQISWALDTIPFFFDPYCDYKMACLPSCQGPDNPPRYEPTSYTEYMLWFAARNYPQVNPTADEVVAVVPD